MSIKWPIMSVCGVILMLSGLWGGSWLLSLFPYGSPYNFAAFLTTLIVTVGGLVLLVYSVIHIEAHVE